MSHAIRRPTMQTSLNNILKSGVEINTVLDVGVSSRTKPLIDVFPDKIHHLFEPVDTHFKHIRNHYNKIEHVLHQVAISDSDGDMYLACKAIRNDGIITHSRLVENKLTKDDMPNLVSCNKVRRAKLDTIVSEYNIEGPYILKIDVDGHEMNILKGAAQTIEDSSILVIEAPLPRIAFPQFFERAMYLLDHGFFLIDIVDLAYYDGILWQADLVFVKKEIAQKHQKLLLWQSKSFNFEMDKWYVLGDDKFENK